MKTLSAYISDVLGRERIFTIIKPGFLQHTQYIMDMFRAEGWTESQTTIKQLTLKEAKELYKVHKDEKWYDSLCEYMSSGPSRAIIYVRPGQQDSGTYESVAALKDKIRKKWGIDDCKNVMHSSDGMSAMEHESSIYF